MAWAAVVGAGINLLGMANQQDLASDQMDWQVAVQKKLSDAMIARARKKLDHYRQNYLPLQKEMMATAVKGVRPDTETAAGMASADTAQAVASQRRGLTRPGGNMYSKAYGLGAGAASLSGKTGALATERERTRAKDLSNARRVQMTSIGRGLPTAANMALTGAGATAQQAGAQGATLLGNYGQLYENVGNIASGVGGAVQGFNNQNNTQTTTTTTTGNDELLGPPNV